ncbi:hypothetical protein ACHHYP_17041, partial [Achlya hypogyna]
GHPPLSGDWACDTTVSRLDCAHPPSVGALVRWATSLVRVRCALCDGRLLVQSAWRVYPSEPSAFELDGKPHVLRAWPNGEATLGSRVLEGDYVGRAIGADVDLVCYAFDFAAHSSSRVALRLRPDGTRVQCGFEWHRLALALTADVAAWSAADRIALWNDGTAVIVASGTLVYEPCADGSPSLHQ